MPLHAIGLNHESAKLALREQVAFVAEEIENAHTELLKLGTVAEGVILSTCNRTEILVQSEAKASELHAAVLDWLSGSRGLESKLLQDTLYHREGDDALRHIIRVAAGLDSLVLGEPQIFGQLKSSVAIANQQGGIGPRLNEAFEHVYQAVKRIRTHTAIGRNPVSVAFAAVSLAQRIFSRLDQSRILLLGAGETAELVARHFGEKGVREMVVANRSLPGALKLAKQFSAKAALLSEIHAHLPAADIIVSSTASQLPVLGKGAVESAIAHRRRRPVFIVDLAVPRDVEPEVAELDDVYLYTVDDLAQVIDEGRKQRSDAASQAESYIDQALGEYTRALAERDAVDSVVSLRKALHSLAESEREKALASLRAGLPPEAIINRLTHALTNKILHEPTRNLRAAARDHDHEAAHQFLRMMGLDPADESDSSAARPPGDQTDTQ